MAAAKLNLECLGQLRLTLGKKALALPLKAQVLVCYLAVSGRPHSREALAGLLWAELSEEAARANLRTMLPKLRQALGLFLVISRETIAFNRASTYRFDVELFLDNLSNQTDADITKLREAVTLYRGDFLEGFHLDGVPLFEEWLLGQRERLKQLAVQALHMLAVHHTEREEYATATDYLSRLLALEPWREDSHRQLMLLLALSGQRDAALAQYRRCCEILDEELGLEPSEETTELYEKIKAGDVEARLPTKLRHNLPLLPTALIGRHEELARIAELLASCRLLTLVGPGGVGKTSLALQAARQALAAFPDGVFFVPLAAVSGPELVASTIAQALDVQEVAGQPLLESIKARLRDKETLLLLDNFEHLLAASPIVAALLAHCPKLKVMTTSRAVLNLRGEHEFEVPPLAVPDLWQALHPEALMQYPAVALFSERARAVKPDFGLTGENAVTVATICARLDGLPLAIELAAARVKFMSLELLLIRLGNRLKLLTGGARDLPLHQQTLRHTIAWSCELLEPEMRLLFARLAVFVGSFSLEAAEEVCASPSLNLDILEGLTRLASKSLLQREELDGEVRFRMLEMIREFALERLEESGEADVLRKRYAAFFFKLAERAELEMKGVEQVRWLTSLETELDHLRAALRWTFESREVEANLRLAGALPWFWFTRGRFREGREWLEKALAVSDMKVPRLRAKALYGAGMLARRQGDYEAAAAQLKEGLELFRQRGDKGGVAACLHHLAHVAEAHGDYVETKARFQESLALAREAEDIWELTLTLNCLGHAAYAQGDAEWAEALLEESLPLCQKLGNKYGIGDALRLLGLIALDREGYQRASLLLEESLALQTELGNKQGMALLFVPLARAALHNGDAFRATMLLRQGLALRSEEDELGLVQCLNELAEVASAQGDFAWSARLLGAAEALHEVYGASLGRLYLDRRGYLIAKVEAQLGKQVFAKTWQEGQTMGLVEAVAYTLDTS